MILNALRRHLRLNRIVKNRWQASRASRSARLDYPLVGEFKFFKAGVRPSVVVRLTDDAGVQGWGQAVPVETWTYETVESVESTLARYLAPGGPRRRSVRPADVHARMERAIRPSFSVGQPLAKAALDLACYDLWGKQTGRRCASCSARRPSRRSSSAGRSTPPASRKRTSSSSRAAPRATTSYNVKIGPPQTPDYDREPDSRGARFRAAAASTGPTPTRATTSTTALAMAPRLARRRLPALESPLPPNRMRDYQALKRQGALPILMDEGIVSPVEAEEFAALGMLDGVAMKVARCGGLWHASRIVEHAQREKLYCCSPRA